MTDAGTGAAVVVTVVLPIVDRRDDHARLVDSLIRQADSRWRLIVVGRRAAVTSLALPAPDSRVHTVFAESDDLADLMATGLAASDAELVLFAARDGWLDADAVRTLADRIAADPRADVLYCDEGAVPGGRGPRIHRKPDYSPERLRNQFYIGGGVFYRASLLREIGGPRAGFAGAELYDLALRATAAARNVVHLTAVLWHVPPGADLPGPIRGESAVRSTRLALEEHLASTGGGQVGEVCESGSHETHRLVEGEPLVSIIIPTRGSAGLVRGEARVVVLDSVRSVVRLSTYPNYELVLVVDDVAPPEVIAELREIAGDRLRLITWARPFSFSAKMNCGVFHARGDYLLFLNDDTEVISPGWIESMLSLCQRPGAGMSGAMLYFEDDAIQHAGHLYVGGNPGHIGTDSVRGDAGPQHGFRLEREVSGVTAACSMMPRAVFEAVGGFTLELPNNFNDVDLCMKVGYLGHQIYWTPYAELYHYESKTRESRVTRYELETLRRRWELRLDDPRYWPYGAAAQ